MQGPGSGSVQEKQKALLEELIERVNGLFEGQLTDDDQLIYVNGVIKGKLLENATLREQAASNSKEQFAHSPDLARALNSPRVREGLKDILLGPGELYETLRECSEKTAEPV